MTQELYDGIGQDYSDLRREDPRIAARIRDALGDIGSLLNVGAGTGLYEPEDARVVSVDPSSSMLLQRRDTSCSVRARAEHLPFSRDSFDAVMAVLTVHHWSDKRLGLLECARVARRRIVLFTWDPASPGFWLTTDYFPEILKRDRTIFPSMEFFSETLGEVDIEAVEIPADCLDGFLGAYWKRPEAYLDVRVRQGMSTFREMPDPDAGIARLEKDLRSGVWHARNRELEGLESLDAGYRLVTATF